MGLLGYGVTVLQFLTSKKAKTLIFATIIGGSSMCLLATGLWSYHVAESYVTKALDHYLESLRTKWHLNISYGEMHFTANGAVIEGLKIENGFQTLIASLEVTWDLNPLSKSFGVPQSLQITHFYTKIRRGKMPQLLHSMQDFLGQGRSAAAPATERREFATLVPRDILIEKGDIAVTDDDNNPLWSCKGVHLVKDGKTGEIKVEFNSIIFQEAVVAERAGVELITATSGQNEAFPLLAHLRKDGEEYVIKGEISHNLDSIKLVSKWRALPFLPAKMKENLVLGDDSHFAASLKVVGLKDPQHAILTANVIARNVGLNHASIANTPVMFDKIKVLTRSQMDPSSQSLTATGKLTLARQDENGEDTEGFDILLTLAKNRKAAWGGAYHVDLELPSSPCETIKNSLPNALRANIEGFELAGNAALKMGLDMDLQHPDAFIYQIADASYDCTVVKAPDAYSTARMTQQFGTQGDNGPLGIEAGEKARNYVPIRDISPYLTHALVASEDAGFYSHKGISWPAMLNALRRNLKDRSISLGGSTITMQMVKNLFLSRERTVCRKLQEIFLASYVETILPKNKILEVYANIIEYGPDLYGIGQASRRFFGKTPASLTVMESAYIAALLPNPKGRYVYFCQNKISENFMGLVNANVQKMYEQNMISDGEMDAALKERLRFSMDEGPTAECHGNLASFESQEQEALRVEF